jgi:taurine dioxygenase
MVRTHPGTGRKALYVNRRFTIHVIDLSEHESEDLLLELFDYAEAPAHIYRHRWSKDQLVMWDNRCTVHQACGGVPESQFRTMHRTSIRGQVPIL